MKQESSKNYQDSFNTLKNTISFLRSKEGCPWDQKQTHNSLKKNLLEESYELLEALESKEPQKIKEELGFIPKKNIRQAVEDLVKAFDKFPSNFLVKSK